MTTAVVLAQTVYLGSWRKNAKCEVVSVGFGRARAFNVTLSNKCCTKVLEWATIVNTSTSQGY